MPIRLTLLLAFSTAKSKPRRTSLVSSVVIICTNSQCFLERKSCYLPSFPIVYLFKVNRVKIFSRCGFYLLIYIGKQFNLP